MSRQRAVLEGRREAAPSIAVATRTPISLGLAGKASELATQLLLLTLVPRLLGPRDYGTLAIGLAVAVAGSSFVTMGGPVVMARFVPAAPAAERAAVARTLIVRLARWSMFPLGLTLLAGVVLTVVVPERFAAVTTVLVLAALVLNVAAALAFQVALGFGRAGAWSFRYTIQNVLLAAGVAALYPSAGLDGALVALALASAGGLAAGLLALRGTPFRHRRAPLPTGALRFAALQALGGVLLQLTQRGGVIVVSLFAASRGETGFAAVAIGVSLAAVFTIVQAFTVQLPVLAERWASDAAGAEAAARRLAQSAILAAVPAALVAAPLIGPLAVAVLGERFRGVEAAFAPALAAVVLAPLAALAGQIGSLRLRPEVRAWSAAAGAVVFVATSAVAVPALGAEGATVALLGAMAVNVAVSGLLLRNVFAAPAVALSVVGAAAVLAVGLLA